VFSRNGSLPLGSRKTMENHGKLQLQETLTEALKNESMIRLLDFFKLEEKNPKKNGVRLRYLQFSIIIIHEPSSRTKREIFTSF